MSNKSNEVSQKIKKFIEDEICDPCKQVELENCEECNYKIILDMIKDETTNVKKLSLEEQSKNVEKEVKKCLKSTIVNGISVSKCEYLNSLDNGVYECILGKKQMLKHRVCDCNHNCRFKQLARAKEELTPFQDEYFKGLDTKAIAELAKKSQRLTTENRELEQKNEELKAQVDEWKENCNNNFELVAIRTKLLTDIAIKLGLNTAIIEHKDVFDKIDNLQSKEHELEEIKKEFQVECLQDNITGKRTYRSLKVIKLKEELEEDFEETKEDLRECEFDRNIAQLEANKYKQALEEIEGFIEVVSGECRISEMEWGSIQDIINKAKEQ